MSAQSANRRSIGAVIYDLLKELKSGTNDETNGRHIIPDEIMRACANIQSPRILDVGAGKGADLCIIEKRLNLLGRPPQISAIESYRSSIDALRSRNFSVADVDIERERLPFEDCSQDVVVCNQVLEHTKEIFWVISELSRVAKVGATLILGVPNLGSLHNRVALLFGHQPPAIAVFGPHVRGFTIQGLSHVIELDKILEIKRVIGGNFYPFPPWFSRKLSNVLPSLSVTSFYVVEKVRDDNYLNLFAGEHALQLVDTPYFKGN